MTSQSQNVQTPQNVDQKNGWHGAAWKGASGQKPIYQITNPYSSAFFSRAM